MIEFKSEDKYEITARGTVFIVLPKVDIPLNDVFKKNIIIDQVEYFCSGIERFAKCRPKDAPLEAGEKIGILVSKKKEL